MHIALLHTAQVHVATFDALLDAQGFDGQRSHVVRPDLLARAQAEGHEAVRAAMDDALAALAGADCILCTCSTLGPLAEQLATRPHHVLRIDRPMMEAACGHGSDILVAVCLESTRDATLALLSACGGAATAPRLILCDTAWGYFEAGDAEGFAGAIETEIRAEVARRAPDCIVLAQASMRVAEDRLRDLGLPVLSSPEPAVARALRWGQARADGHEKGAR